MAKKEINKEKKQREQEKEAAKRKKAAHKRVINEKKRIKSYLQFPFKMLFNTSLLISLIFLVYRYYWQNVDIYRSIVNFFIIFSALYLGFGSIMVTVFFVLAERKRKDNDLLKRLEEEAFNRNSVEGIDNLNEISKKELRKLREMPHKENSAQGAMSLSSNEPMNEGFSENEELNF